MKIEKLQPSLPQGWNHVRHLPSEWNVYRTRFLIKARQLTEPLVFVDFLGREHRGNPGDYLVESSDGTRRIAAREIFEDIYVVLEDSGGPTIHSSAKLGRSRKSAIAASAIAAHGNRGSHAAETPVVRPNPHH
jgi:hypothetical protein